MKFTVLSSSVLAAAVALSAPALAQQASDGEQPKAQQRAERQQAKQEKQQQAADANQKQSDARASGARQPAEPVVLTVTTVSFAESTGCWAKLHDGENFSGRTLTLMGAQALPNLEFGVDYDWEGDVDSIQVGPKAKLALYDDENYEDDRRDLAANARVADLHKALFAEGIESLSLSCTGDAAR